MSRRAKKVCSRPGCPNLVDAGTGRCDACAGGSERERGTAAERGYDSRWRATRAGFLEEYPFCAEAGCMSLAEDVDHIDGEGPLGPRGHDWSNLRGLCKAHHSRRTARDQPGGWNRR